MSNEQGSKPPKVAQATQLPLPAVHEPVLFFKCFILFH
jgi:hypothetical protein